MSDTQIPSLRNVPMYHDLVVRVKLADGHPDGQSAIDALEQHAIADVRRVLAVFSTLAIDSVAVLGPEHGEQFHADFGMVMDIKFPPPGEIVLTSNGTWFVRMPGDSYPTPPIASGHDLIALVEFQNIPKGQRFK